MEGYNPVQVITHDGKLVLGMDQRKDQGLEFTSCMLQSWSKLCFMTGYFAASVSVPGGKPIRKDTGWVYGR
jgi:beta-glucanase (GH16 family)